MFTDQTKKYPLHKPNFYISLLSFNYDLSLVLNEGRYEWIVTLYYLVTYHAHPTPALSTRYTQLMLWRHGWHFQTELNKYNPLLIS